MKKLKKPIFTKQEIKERSLIFSRKQMLDYMERKAGEKISAAEFEAMMYELLPLESYYQGRIMFELNVRYGKNGGPGCFLWKAAAGPYSRQGIPDICAVIGGLFFGLEVKRPYIGKPTGIQEETIYEIRAAGGHSAIVHTPSEAIAFIDKCLAPGQEAEST